MRRTRVSCVCAFFSIYILQRRLVVVCRRHSHFLSLSSSSLLSSLSPSLCRARARAHIHKRGESFVQTRQQQQSRLRRRRVHTSFPRITQSVPRELVCEPPRLLCAVHRMKLTRSCSGESSSTAKQRDEASMSSV